MTQLALDIPEKLIPVFCGEADFRGAYGGRGSAKSRTFALMSAAFGIRFAQRGQTGIILCGRQYQNSIDDSSFFEVKAAIQENETLNNLYDCGERYIKTKDGRVSYAFSGLERNINSVKGKSRILLCWIDEAEDVLEDSWTVLLPTVREDKSEVWATWNPRRKGSPVDRMLRHSNDPLIKVVEMNWRDNPKFPEKLNRQRLRDAQDKPDLYGHIWEGGYLEVVPGAYFTKELLLAKEQNRIGRVAADPLMSFHVFIDIGGTGARADAFTMWVTQIIGKEIRVLDYYEVVGQPAATHLQWLKDKKYLSNKTQIWLPHDGSTQDKVYDASYESVFGQSGYDVTVIPNQGKGAAKQRIEAIRRWLSACWFNEETTQAGREALAWYHEKRDEARNIGLGPNHDWASHGADSFGLCCIVADEIMQTARPKDDEVYYTASWMG